jgi:hypothetical protein
MAAGLVFASAVVGCGSSGDGASSASASATTAPVFEGRYVADGPGEISAIDFHSPSYSLTPATCATASCVDVGTYSIDSALGTITLRTSSTGAARTLTLVVLESQPLMTSTPASVEVNRLEPRDDLVQQPRQPLTKSTGNLTTESEILRARLDDQKIASERIIGASSSPVSSTDQQQLINRNTR